MTSVDKTNTIENNFNSPESQLTNEMKGELTDLAKRINVLDTSKAFQAINDLLDKINDPEEGLNDFQKNVALHHALKESPIYFGNKQKKLLDVAELFEKHVVQDGASRKLKIAENSQLTDEERTLISPYLNETKSPLAYLIQRSAQFIKLQAQKGYGKESDKLLDVKLDSAFGNQTKRALGGLKSWIESDLKTEEAKIEVKKLKVGDILGMHYISEALKKRIEESGKDDIKNLWQNLDKENSQYEYKAPYTNNYALKEKGSSSASLTSDEDIEQNKNQDENKTEEKDNLEQEEKIKSRRNNLIKAFSLMEIKDSNFYTRENYSGLYSFGEDNILYYSGSDYGNLKFIGPKEENWQHIKEKDLPSMDFKRQAIIHSLSLQKTGDNCFKREGYKGQYAFDENGTLFYSGIDYGNLKFLGLKPSDAKVKRDFSTPVALGGSLSSWTKKIIKKEIFPKKERKEIAHIPDEIAHIAT